MNSAELTAAELQPGLERSCSVEGELPVSDFSFAQKVWKSGDGSFLALTLSSAGFNRVGTACPGELFDALHGNIPVQQLGCIGTTLQNLGEAVRYSLGFSGGFMEKRTVLQAVIDSPQAIRATKQGHAEACRELANTPRQRLDDCNPNHHRNELQFFGEHRKRSWRQYR